MEPTDDVLREVAEVYRLALGNRSAPRKAVVRRFGVSRSTAARWLTLTRESGFLALHEITRGGRPATGKRVDRYKAALELIKGYGCDGCASRDVEDTHLCAACIASEVLVGD